jgi:glycosyltransferase involved in cell wall biosynthesis
MYHADLIGGLAAKLTRICPIVWGIRQSSFDPHTSKRSSVWTANACARLSRWLPAKIVCCSEAARQTHEQLGYAAEKMVIIPNGFALDTFRPNEVARYAVRQEFGLSNNTPLIGLVARFDPLKDHQTFVRAAGLLAKQISAVRFLLCGDGVDWNNKELVNWIDTVDLRSRCYLLGRREDVPSLMAALDVATLSSCSEAFPNVLGEAMACAIPCVVTNVGDAALIVGETGLVVPPRDPQRLADGWRTMLERGPEGRRLLGAQARKRIETHYSLQFVVKQYETLYQNLVGG